MKEALFFALLAFAGYGLCARVSGRKLHLVGVAAAFPLGVLAWTVLAIALVAMRLHLINAIWILVLLGIVCYGHFRSQDLVEALFPGLVIAGLAAVVTLLCAWSGWIQVSFDSVEQVAVGRALAQRGLDDELGTLLASWGVLLPLIQGAGVFLNVDILTGAQPLLWLSCIGLICGTVWQVGGERFRLPIALLALVFVASPYFFVFQSAYVHNSLASATFLLLFFAAALLAIRERVDGWIHVSFLGLLGFTLARTEAPMFAALGIMLAASWFEAEGMWAQFRRATLLYVACAIAWCLALISMIGTGSDIMTPGRLAVLIVALVAAALVVCWPQERFFGKELRRYMPLLIGGATLVALWVGYYWKPAHSMENLAAIVRNLFFTGRWGVSWWMLSFLLPLMILRGAGIYGLSLLAFSFAFFGLVLSMGLMRIPYRTGWGDSANRIFVHLWPILALWMGLTMAKRVARVSAPRSHPVSFGRIFLIGALVALAANVSYWFGYWQPSLKSSDVVVLRADGFCPPDKHGRYDFAVALVAARSDSYAAACSSGPRTVELRVDDGQQFRWIELEEYAPSDAWTDFGIRISADGVIWTTVFEHRPDGDHGPGVRVSSTVWRISMPNDGVNRFIAVDYRASLGQNRLLLRRLTFAKP